MRSVLQERAVTYINIDSAVVFPGTLQVGGSPLLHNLLRNSAKLVGVAVDLLQSSGDIPKALLTLQNDISKFPIVI